MRFSIRTLVLSVIFTAVSVGQAHATILWDWAFLDNNQTFGPDDTVVLYGRLFNQSTAGETIGNSDSGSDATLVGFEAHPIPFYSFQFGPEDAGLFDAFGTPIAAGGYRDFVFGRELPVGVPEGEYAQATGIDLRTGFADDAPVVWRIDRDFSWTVADPPQPVVPEPGSLSLFAFGLGGWFIARKR